MVLIFALPRTDGAHQQNSPSEGNGRREGTFQQTEPQTPGRDRSDPKEGPASDIALLDGPNSEASPSVSPATPTRRTRRSARKTVKPAAEPVPEPAPTAWLQVGPGKFVRADAQPAATPEPHAPIEPSSTPVEEEDDRQPAEEPAAAVEPALADQEPVDPIPSPAARALDSRARCTNRVGVAGLDGSGIEG